MPSDASTNTRVVVFNDKRPSIPKDIVRTLTPHQRAGARYIVPGHEDNPYYPYRYTRQHIICLGAASKGFVFAPYPHIDPTRWHYG